jgi:hypothetical protein
METEITIESSPAPEDSSVWAKLKDKVMLLAKKAGFSEKVLTMMAEECKSKEDAPTETPKEETPSKEEVKSDSKDMDMAAMLQKYSNM